MEVLKDQIVTLLENGLHDLAQMLALLGDTFFREREYRRAIHNYKQALQYYKMIPKQNTPSSWSSLSSNRKSNSLQEIWMA
ncbi:hypothetical protein K1719_008114 [Acacia pycnantha]|nr:hypothetical protein K1719_008114 [Acacia pycnantha]